MHIVLLNGPAGAGKNTLANQLMPAIHSRLKERESVRKLLKRPVSSIAIAEFKQPLIDMLFAFAESLSVIEWRTERTDRAYESLKKTIMLGRTGREWQIIWANAMRAVDSSVFIDGLHAKGRAMNPDVLLVPDCGFTDEHWLTVQKFGEPNVTLIYLDGWKQGVKRYGHLDRFDEDIRICLRDSAPLVNPTVDVAAGYIVGRMLDTANQASLDF